MASYLLDKIKIEGVARDIIARSNAENVTVKKEDGTTTTLAAELAAILLAMTDLPTGSAIDEKIDAAISALVDEAPETLDTLKEIADYIANNEDAMTALNAAIGNKVDKVAGKGLSAEDFTAALKSKLEGLTLVTVSGTNGNILLDGVETPVYTHPTGAGFAHIPAGGTEGQALVRTADGYGFGDMPRGVRFGTAVPEDLEEGELFVLVQEG